MCPQTDSLLMDGQAHYFTAEAVDCKSAKGSDYAKDVECAEAVTSSELYLNLLTLLSDFDPYVYHETGSVQKFSKFHNTTVNIKEERTQI